MGMLGDEAMERNWVRVTIILAFALMYLYLKHFISKQNKYGLIDAI